MEIRHPHAGDVLPVPLELQKFDPAWVWLMNNAILIAAGGHDLVILLRLIRYGEMQPLWAHQLLRHVFNECKERGYQRFMVFLDRNSEQEMKLLEIAAHYYGAQHQPFNGELAMGIL